MLKAKVTMTLNQKQSLFSVLVAELILFAERKGYKVTFGEAWRPNWVAAMYAKQRRGIKNSLHTFRLAIDLNLFKNGKYLTESEDHRELGEFWESLDPMCVWGGRFGDGNHYGFTHNGIK